MTSAGNPNANIIPETTLYDAVNHQVVAWEADESTVTTDTSVTPNITYAKAKISGTFSSSPPSDLSGTGTISAAQPTINTPVASATVVLALGTGQSTWKAMLSNGGGGFTGATTLVADKSPDGGTTWFSSSFKVNGASPNTPASTVVGPGPLELTGNAAGATHVRIRCSVLNSTETIAVRIDASTGVAEVGIIAPLPAGPNKIGGVTAGAGDFVDLATLVANTADLLADGDNLATIATNTTGIATAAAQTTAQTSLSAIKTDLDTIVTNTADLLADGDNLATIQTNTANIPAKGTAVMTGSTPVTIATNDTLTAAMKTDLDTLVTNTADLLADGDNLATIATNTANIPAKGAAVTSASTPVNIASDQVVPVKRNAVAVYSLASTQSTGSTQNSGDLTVGPYTEVSLDINTTAQSGTNPTVQFFYERKGADGIYYVLWQSNVLTAATNTLSTSIGAGMAYNQSLGSTGRLRWVVGGSSTPTYTFSANLTGK